LKIFQSFLKIRQSTGQKAIFLHKKAAKVAKNAIIVSSFQKMLFIFQKPLDKQYYVWYSIM